MNYSSRLIVFLFLFISCSLDAQQLITSYSVDQGLPQSTVTSLYRDNEGYLWCGTGHGLGLYDGWKFQQPVIASGEKSAPVINSIIRGIIPSSDQKTVWVGTEGSVYQFDRFSLKVLKSVDIVNRPGAGEQPILANDTAVWVLCSGRGLYRVRISDGKASQITSSGYSGGGSRVGSRLIVFTDSVRNLLFVDFESSAVQTIYRPAWTQSFEMGCAVPAPGKQNRILIATSEGLWQCDLKLGTIERYLLGDKRYNDSTFAFTSIAVHPNGSMWLAVREKGIFRYDPATFLLRPCLWQQDGTPQLKAMNAPTQIICDDYGVVWCGTDGGGVVKLLHDRIAFGGKFTNPLVTDTCNWFTRCFYEMSKQRYLVGTYQQGIKLIDEAKNTITTISTDPAFTGANAMFITESGDGRLLVGTDRSVLLLDTSDWRAEEVDISSVQGGKFVGYLRSDDGKLYVYGTTGFRLFTAGTHPALSAPLGKIGNVTSALQLSNGDIVEALRYEGMAVHNRDLQLKHHYDFEKDLGFTRDANVRGLCEDDNGFVWIGLESGLFKFTSEFRAEGKYTTANGLPDNTIYDLAPFGQYKFIATTGHGVCIFDYSADTFRTLGAPDGLPSDECNSSALLFSERGYVYVGTTAGFVRWNPTVSTACYRNTMMLASFGENQFGQSGIIRESIIRDYGSGAIELNIWQTDFAFPERVVFSHQLEGSGEDEISELGLRKVNYAALGSGFYSFICSAAVPGCEPTAITKLFTIKIVPPYWMSGWFIGVTSMGVVLLITVILFVIMRMNYQRKLRKLRMQQELDKVRQRISRDIHDEIGAGLTRIALSGDLMSQKIDKSDSQYDKLKVIAGTARELSQSMKEVVWSVNPHYDNLDHMAAYFRSYVSGVAENGDLRFVYTADEKWPDVQVNPETRRNLLLILKESISNAVKYSQATELRLELHWKNNQFSMLIADNGKGFDLQTAEGVNSNGLRNIRQRAEASGCVVVFSSSPEKGTSALITGSIEKI